MTFIIYMKIIADLICFHHAYDFGIAVYVFIYLISKITKSVDQYGKGFVHHLSPLFVVRIS